MASISNQLLQEYQVRVFEVYGNLPAGHKIMSYDGFSIPADVHKDQHAELYHLDDVNFYGLDDEDDIFKEELIMIDLLDSDDDTMAFASCNSSGFFLILEVNEDGSIIEHWAEIVDENGETVFIKPDSFIIQNNNILDSYYNI